MDTPRPKSLLRTKRSEYVRQPCAAGVLRIVWICGASFSRVANLKIYVAISTFINGGIDHIPADVFKAFPKLTALHAAVKAHPKVAEWQSSGGSARA